MTVGTIGKIALKKRAPKASALIEQSMVSCAKSLFMTRTGLPLMESNLYSAQMKILNQSLGHFINKLILQFKTIK